MAKINEAYHKKTKTVIDLSVISTANDFEELKQDLFCPTENCDAKLDFVNGHTETFLRTHPKENHTKDCPYFFERDASKKRSKKLVEISVTMGEEESDNRLGYLFKTIYKKKKNSTSRKRSRPNKTTDNNSHEGTEHIEAVLVNSGSETTDLSTLKESSTTIVRGPKTYNRALNQITINDAFVKTYGYATHAILEDNSCEIHVRFEKKEGVFIFPSSFFKEYVQANEFMGSLCKYINQESNSRFPIMLLVMGEIKNIPEKDQAQPIYVNKYVWLSIVIEEFQEPPKRMKLASFVAQKNTGIFNNKS
ncbi:hypothetical protein HCJ66_03000 [Listeria sp. FSL L7-1582]|uniref:hypothetical protein n=1 Tax=Listeria portnoyi TaxID=2713504 RepID=UPI00164EA94F|nr:hypothetical protein [Listeria portnoyi]MBC6308515.1 hypothetical protein [Listeria portnoyi]